MRRIKFTYDVVTPESAEQGDFAETGWVDEDGIAIEPDADEDAVSLACDAITRQCGCVEPSSYPSWHAGVWYTSSDGEQDYRTGEHTRYSAHLEGFSEQGTRAPPVPSCRCARPFPARVWARGQLRERGDTLRVIAPTFRMVVGEDRYYVE